MYASEGRHVILERQTYAAPYPQYSRYIARARAPSDRRLTGYVGRGVGEVPVDVDGYSGKVFTRVKVGVVARRRGERGGTVFVFAFIVIMR